MKRSWTIRTLIDAEAAAKPAADGQVLADAQEVTPMVVGEDESIARPSNFATIWPHFLIGYGMIVSVCWTAMLVWLLFYSVTTGVQVISASIYSRIATKQIGTTTGQMPKLYGLEGRSRPHDEVIE